MFIKHFQDRQEARMQVIAADLDQAQQVADFLQRMLDERENQLHTELYQTDMNNQMISMCHVGIFNAPGLQR